LRKIKASAACIIEDVRHAPVLCDALDDPEREDHSSAPTPAVRPQGN
jgi:hypothetical protein